MPDPRQNASPWSIDNLIYERWRMTRDKDGIPRKGQFLIVAHPLFLAWIADQERRSEFVRSSISRGFTDTGRWTLLGLPVVESADIDWRAGFTVLEVPGG